MNGRRLISDEEASARGFTGPEAVRRRAVLRETIQAFECVRPPCFYHDLAAANLERWKSRNRVPASPFRVEVRDGDWGEVTYALTRQVGTCFAVLNMANASVPGGAYVEGAIAQEENMFRRTDCHFKIDASQYDPGAGRYLPAMNQLLNAQQGAVYLDSTNPRVCIRGPEDRTREDLGYPWLPHNQVFPFFELRAAANDLRDGSDFELADARRRIRAQLDTLHRHGIRHAVLSAFGCGAFCNPAEPVARIYCEELRLRQADFSLIAFAILAPGYGPDNFTAFTNELAPC